MSISSSSSSHPGSTASFFSHFRAPFRAFATSHARRSSEETGRSSCEDESWTELVDGDGEGGGWCYNATAPSLLNGDRTSEDQRRSYDSQLSFARQHEQKYYDPFARSSPPHIPPPPPVPDSPSSSTYPSPRTASGHRPPTDKSKSKSVKQRRSLLHLPGGGRVDAPKFDKPFHSLHVPARPKSDHEQDEGEKGGTLASRFSASTAGEPEKETVKVSAPKMLNSRGSLGDLFAAATSGTAAGGKEREKQRERRVTAPGLMSSPVKVEEGPKSILKATKSFDALNQPTHARKPSLVSRMSRIPRRSLSSSFTSSSPTSSASHGPSATGLTRKGSFWSKKETPSGSGGGLLRRLGRAVTGSGKSEKDSPSPVVVFAEKRNIDIARPISATTLPSRIPLSAVFPSLQGAPNGNTSRHLAPIPPHLAAAPSQIPRPIGRPVPRRRPIRQPVFAPTSSPIRAVSVSSMSAREKEARPSIKRARSAMMQPSPTAEATRSTFESGDSDGCQTPPTPSPGGLLSNTASVQLGLGPPPTLRSPIRLVAAPSVVTPAAVAASRDSLDSQRSTSSSSFRPRSIASFRDLIPSPPACSSPLKNEKDMPAPATHAEGERRSPGARKLAIGPEAFVAMSPPRAQGIPDVCGATSDLADLIHSLTDNDDLDADTSLLSPPPVPPLPAADAPDDEEEADVPEDLKALFDVIDDHMSELSVEITPSDWIVQELESSMGHHLGTSSSPTRVEQLASSTSSMEGASGTTALDYLLDEDGAQGLLLLAAAAQVVNQDGGRDEDDEEDRYARPMRESVREYMDLARPSIGEKMLDTRHDRSAHSSSSSSSLPLERRNGPSTWDDTDDIGQQADDESPTPANGLRQSIGVSLPRTRPPFRDSRRLSTRSLESLDELCSAYSGMKEESDDTKSSLASNASSELSMSSSGSPCPLRRQRSVPMLGSASRRWSVKPMKPIVGQRPFGRPYPTAAPISAVKKRGSVSSSWSPDTPESPEAGKKPSISPPRQKHTSPFQRAFNPLEEFRSKNGKRSNEEPMPELGSKVSISPRFVRPFEGLIATGPPRPLPLDQAVISPSHVVPPDTPPPSSPSIASRPLSQETAQASRPASSSSIVSFLCEMRQLSRSSQLLSDVIVEEDSHDEGMSPRATIPTPRDSPKRHGLLMDVLGLGEEVNEGPPSPFPSRPDADAPVSPSPVAARVLPASANDALEEHHDYRTRRISSFNTRMAPVIRSWNDPDSISSENELINKDFAALCFEAEMVIRSSQAMYPDSPRSAEIMNTWTPPKGTYATLEFLFDSQRRYHSLKRTARWSIPSSCLSPGDAASHGTPELSPDSDGSPPRPVVSPPSPTPLPQTTTVKVHLVRRKPVPLVDEHAPRRGAEHPVAPQPLKKSVNKRVAALKDDVDKENPSPFTALPPRVGAKLRAKRPKSVLHEVTPNTNLTKKVDVAFLGAAATKRRVDQFNAAQRRLEGIGTPDEQRSDEDSDDHATLDFLSKVAHGTGTGGFVKTPRLSTSRPRVRPKTVLSSLK